MKNDESDKKEFLIEEIKVKPINKRKLFRRTAITVAMALIFGFVACFTFLILEPKISAYLYPPEEPVFNAVTFPEDIEEMTPEDMLSDNVEPEETAALEEIVINIDEIEATEDTLPGLTEEEVLKLISQKELSLDDYVSIFNEMDKYMDGLMKYIVTVTAVSTEPDWMNEISEKKNLTTGVIVAENGVELLILADTGIANLTKELTVTMSNGKSYYGYIKDWDKDTGLGMVAVPFENLSEEILAEPPIVQMGSSSERTIYSLPVVTVGRCFGRLGSIGFGRVLAYTVLADTYDTNYSLLQTNITCSSDVSGMMFDTKGRLIGVITRRRDTSDSKNLVSAYGISSIKKLIEKLANVEPRAYLGVKVMDVTSQAQQKGVPKGIIVTGIAQNSAAMKCGIQKGDVIVSMDEKPITKYSDFFGIISTKAPEETVKLSIKRMSQDEYKVIEIETVLDSKD